MKSISVATYKGREPAPIASCSPLANYDAHKDEILRAIATTLDRGRYILAEEVSLFEREFAAYIGVRFAVGVGNGTDALHVALRACGVGPGDEVITVSHTAVATVAAIELCGAVPILTDVDAETYTMNPECLSGATTSRTKAIVPVHLYGHPAPMEEISRYARQHGLWLIEDCAQAHGAASVDTKLGALGDMATFSFYPTKNLSALGDAGIVVTDNRDLADKARLLRQYGWRDHYVSTIPGSNSRLDELQASILRVKLRYLDSANSARAGLAAIYDEMLKEAPIHLPWIRPGAKHAYHQYVVRTEHRDEVRQFLAANGVSTLVHYPVPVHLQPAYAGRIRSVGKLRVTESLSKLVLSLPMYPELPQESVERVATLLLAWYKEAR